MAEALKFFRIKRTGMAPLIFKGEEVASVSGQYMRNRENNRWWDLTLYRSEFGHYVLQVSYYTNWQGELPRHEVGVCDSESDLCFHLARCGYFTGQVMTSLGEDAARIGPLLKQQLCQLVTDLYDQLDDEFGEPLISPEKDHDGESEQESLAETLEGYTTPEI
jgi:hypothetical protein